MLADFQQALADLTASPALCDAVRAGTLDLASRYRLTPREHARLAAIVRSPGMACACMLYRANRLAPLALNVPDTCAALGSDLRQAVSDYWNTHPETNVHFYAEADRFCTFLRTRLESGQSFAVNLPPVLEREAAIVSARLAASYTDGFSSPP